MTSLADIYLANSLVGKRVRFRYLRADSKAKATRVVEALPPGFIRLEGRYGYFRPRLFVVVDSCAQNKEAVE